MTKIAGSMNTRPLSRVAIIALMMSVLTVVVVVMSTIGFRMELWGYGSSLKILRVAVVGGVTAIVLSIIGIALTWPGRDRRGFGQPIAAALQEIPDCFTQSMDSFQEPIGQSRGE